MAAGAQAGTTRGLSNPWLVLAILLALFTLNYADRFLIAGLVGHIKGAFILGDGFMGLLLGPAFALFYSLASIPIARIADRRSRVAVIGLGCFVWSTGTILSGLATGPWWLVGARIIVGLGEAAFSAPAYSLLSSYFPPEKRGRAFGIFMLAVYFGQVGGYVLGPVLADALSWRHAFVLMGIPGLFMAALEFFAITEPRRVRAAEREAARAAHQPPFFPLLKTLVTTPAFLYMSLALGFGSLSGLAYALWGPTLFARHYGVPMRTAAGAFGLLSSVSAFAGAILFGVVADRIGRGGMHRVLWLAAGSLSFATLGIVAIAWAPVFAGALALMVPAGVLGAGYAVGAMAVLQYLLPDRYRATATALSALGVTLIGFVIGPWVAGAISEALGDNGRSLQWALTLVQPAGLVGAALYWRAARHLAADRERLAQEQR